MEMPHDESPTPNLPVSECDVNNMKLSGKVLGRGISGIVFRLDGYKVIKLPHNFSHALEQSKREREAYRRFHKNPSPFVLECLALNEPCGIVLEMLSEAVRFFLIRNDPAPTKYEILNWSLQAAQGFAFIHSHGIIQADTGCHNMLLDGERNLKLCDFGGCSIDGEEPLVACERWARHPRITEANKQTDIYGLGCAIWEISRTHAAHSKFHEYMDALTQSFAAFPAGFREGVEPLQAIASGCLGDKYSTADRVAQDLEELVQ